MLNKNLHLDGREGNVSAAINTKRKSDTKKKGLKWRPGLRVDQPENPYTSLNGSMAPQSSGISPQADFTWGDFSG